MIRQLTSFALVATLCYSTAAFSQTPDKDAPPQKPQIRLSGSEDTKKPAAGAEGDKAEASGTAVPKEGEKAGSDPFEEEVLPETPESQVGSQPEPGLGPASPAPQREPGSDFPRPVGEPRVIDISAADDEEEPSAAHRPSEPKVRGSELPFTYHMNHIDVLGGFRVVGVHSDGLQPFLVDPVLADTFIRAGGAFTIVDRFAFAANAELGAAESSATVRTLDSQIDKVNFSLGLEGRYHFLHRMYAYARVAPGFEHVTARVGTRDTSQEMKDSHLGFQMDGALGTALRFAGSSDGRRRDPRLWGFLEGGFRYSTKHALALAADPDVGPPRAEPLELNSLNFSGAFLSFGLMMTF